MGARARSGGQLAACSWCKCVIGCATMPLHAVQDVRGRPRELLQAMQELPGGDFLFWGQNGRSHVRT